MAFPRILFAALWILVLEAGTAVYAADAHIYPDPTQAGADVKHALTQAAAEHKRVILDFGGNWCPDCVALDHYFHDPAIEPLLAANYVLVYVNVGRVDQNLDLAKHYGVPLDKCVPALAVLDSDGRLLYSQTGGEFEDMRHMPAQAVSDFLNRWKP
ncbi:MAG: thioredoxin family protein [Sinobacteraceae bacterium]|nr:thioredoxin family protein [Nevskiaceae bacterium]